MTTHVHDDKYKLVVAIDFGTSFSGYAYSFTKSHNTVILNKEWGNEMGTGTYKTPTCLLTDKSLHAFVSFGYESLRQYTLDDDASLKYCLFKNFKMSLYHEEELSYKTKIKSEDGTEMSAKEAVTMSLKYLSNHFKEALQRSQANDVDESLIKWVITVPAIWSEGAKMFMRRAAFDAKIIPQLNSRSLVLALEPEAASFWCRNLSEQELSCSSEQMMTLHQGIRYLVVDSGGGTTDVTVHEIESETRIKEVCMASGGDWGGSVIDELFIDLLKEVFSSEFINHYRHEHQHDWLHLMIEFEMKKRYFKPSENYNMHIPLSLNFGQTFEKSCSKSLEKLVVPDDIWGVTVSRGYLIIKTKRVEWMFDKVTSKIISHVKNLLDNVKRKAPPIDLIYMVGGLSDSKLLINKMQERFPNVLVPLDAGMSVMRGAVLYGHNPSLVTSRIMRKTYGQSVNHKFDPTKHDDKHRICINGEIRCDGLFKVWAAKNESFFVGESRSFKTYPYSQDAEEAYTAVYCVDKEKQDVKYVDDPGVDKLGVIKYRIPDTHLPLTQRALNTSVVFGDTELFISVEDTTRPHRNKIELKFELE